jgi:hypothetical protein
MTRKSAHDFDQELLALFDAYVHGDLDRRGFLERAAKFAVGGMTAAMLLDELNPNFAEAQVVPPDDERCAPSASTTRRRRLRARCAATWCGRPTPPASCRACW